MTDRKHKEIYEEYYGVEKKEEEQEEQELSHFHKRVLKQLGGKGNTSDKIADKLEVRENDIRRALNELLMERQVSYTKTTKRGKLAYIWKKREG